MVRTATISPCGLYRTTLTRRWDDRPMLLVGMFNPSDADHLRDDPTISLTSHIASHNGFGGITVWNLTPLRSSTPAPAFNMFDRAQVDGDADLRAVLWANQHLLDDLLREHGNFLAAWGAMGHRAGGWVQTAMQSLREVRPKVNVYRLGVCANGHPKHPLARGKHKVPKNAPLLRWEL